METDSEESSSKSIPERIKEIDSTLKSLEKEKECLQDQCDHKSYIIANKSLPGCAFSLHRVCDCCGVDLGYPSQKELDDWIR
jgi:hypothetical protein